MAQATLKKKQEEPEAKSQPVYIARAKVNGDRWESIGAAWHANINGKQGLSVKLNVVPAGAWDGGFLLMPPLEKPE